MRLLRNLVSAVTLACCFSAAHAGVITTTFGYNANSSGNMFDVVTLGGPLKVTGFDLNLQSGSWTIEIYKKNGTWTAAPTQASAWTLVDRASVTSAGPNKRTSFDVQDFLLDGSATTGLYITTTSAAASMLYSAGTKLGNVAASNADLQILQGAGIGYAFGAWYTPRIWNGSIHYELATAPTSVPEPASVVLLGLGLAGVAFCRKKKKAA